MKDYSNVFNYVLEETQDQFKWLWNNTYLKKFRYIILSSGRGAGKSVAIARRLLIKSFDKLDDGIQGNILVIQSTYSAMEEASYAELKKQIGILKLKYFFDIKVSPLSITNKLTGRKFIFRGTDNGEKLKSMADIEIIWFEEADLIKEKDFDDIDLSARGEGKDIKIFLTFNPNNPYTWIRNYINKSNDINNRILYHRSYYFNNKHLDESFINKMDSLKIDNPIKYDRDGLGKFVAPEGVCINNSLIEIVDNYNGPVSYINYGLDFGIVHPTVIVKVGYEEYSKTLIIYDCVSKSVDNNRKFIETLPERWKIESLKIKNGYADSAGPGQINEWKENGFKFISTDKTKVQVNDYIDFVNSCKKIIVCRNAIQFSHECSIWKFKNNSNLPEKINDDINDAVRYALFPILTNRTSGSYSSAKGLY